MALDARGGAATGRSYVPIWGEAKTETDDLIAFAYTYLDEHNKLFQSGAASARKS